MLVHTHRPVVGMNTSGRTRVWTPMILVFVFTTLMGSSHAFAQEAPPYTRHLLETQIGGGPAYTNYGFGGIAHVHARFALWHTIGLGVYSGGLISAESGHDPLVAIPVVGRLNLSLPFWSSFEPTASIGLGPYFFVTSGGGSTLGAQAAFALLFPGRKFGVETAIHVTGDPYFGDELMGAISVAVTALRR